MKPKAQTFIANQKLEYFKITLNYSSIFYRAQKKHLACLSSYVISWKLSRTRIATREQNVYRWSKPSPTWCTETY